MSRRDAPSEPSREDVLARTHRRFGWTSLLVWMSAGLALESLHGIKLGGYLLDPLRREMWTLAHFHGSLLSLLNLTYVRWAEAPGLSPGQRTLASRTLRAGSVLLPLGFALGGAWHYEGDPGPGIFLAPIGGALLLAPVILQFRAAWSGRET
jgi:hypothetical protein